MKQVVSTENWGVRMFGRKKVPQERAVERLAGALQKIGNDSDVLAVRIAKNRPMPKGDAIQVTKTESLFRSTDADGKTVYDFHHYTNDMKSINPQAQIDLMLFFGNIVKLNTVVAPFERQDLDEEIKTPASELLDRIRIQAWFFRRFLARRDVTTSLMMGKTAGAEINREFSKLVAEDDNTMARMDRKLFAPEKFASFLPKEQIPLCMTVGRRSESGEKFVNGVWFPSDEGQKILNHMAELQA